MIVLVPAYEPDARLVDLIRRLASRTVVVVDDGSGPAYAGVFAAVRVLGADVVTLDRNRGKGFALKAGLAHIRAGYPGRDVVCADSDGQHRPEDVDAVAERLAETDADMVLGVRLFTGPVPLRSRVGNAVTRAAYTVATGRRLADTQTGLRAYPARMLERIGAVGGDRFEYELRLLLHAARAGLRVEQVPIATVYLDGNASSHFRPLRDSVCVFGPLLAFSASSLLGFAVDTVAVLVLFGWTGSVVTAAVGARLLSATVNYAVNRAWVFRGGHRTGSARRYAILALAVLVANAALLDALTTLTGSILVAKVITEVTLFAVSFTAQRHLVFPRSRGGRLDTGATRSEVPSLPPR